MGTSVISRPARRSLHGWISSLGIDRMAGMKQVIAVIKPFLAEKVLDGLKRAPLEALNVREVKGYGRQKSSLADYGESEYARAFLPKVEITMWVDDARVDEIVRKIVDVARTGRMGDGKVFVVPGDSYEQVIDIGSAGVADDKGNGKKTKRSGSGRKPSKGKA
jgi:nitrogen regulatory protein P-II 1